MPETGDAVARIFGKAQQRQHVLDMGGIEEFQAAEFHEGDVAPGEFDLQRPGMRWRCGTARPAASTACRLAVLQHALDDIARLVGLVAQRDEQGFCAGSPVGPEVLGETFAGEIDDAVGRGKDRLGRAVVAIERDDVGAAARMFAGSRGCCGRSRPGNE